MAENVRKGGVEVAIDLDLWYVHVGGVCAPYELLGVLAAVFDNLLRIASQKDLADGLLVVQQLGIWEVPGRVERLSEGEVLFCNDSPRNARSQHGGHEL